MRSTGQEAASVPEQPASRKKALTKEVPVGAGAASGRTMKWGEAGGRVGGGEGVGGELGVGGLHATLATGRPEQGGQGF